MKCHGRKLIYSYSKDMTDFVCERCTYIVDNSPDPKEIKSLFQCRFCNEEKGIKIYIDKTTSLAALNQAKDNRLITIGWTHMCCVFWNNFLTFVDETRFEVKQDNRINTYKPTRCKYCQLESSLFPTTTCGYKH